MNWEEEIDSEREDGNGGILKLNHLVLNIGLPTLSHC